MFFGKIKEFKTFNLALLKNLGRAFTSLKTEKNQTCFRDITGRPTCSFVSPNFVQSFPRFGPVFSPPQVKRNCNRDHNIFEFYDVSSQIRFSTSKPRLVKCSTGNLIYELSNDLRLSLEEIRKSQKIIKFWWKHSLVPSPPSLAPQSPPASLDAPNPLQIPRLRLLASITLKKQYTSCIESCRTT